LLEAFIGILERIPDARLVVAGIGLHGEEREFDAAVKRHGLEAKVIQLGWTLPRDLPDIFAAADVALYPLDDTLLNRAKCPMKLVDLLLAGVPVVADAVGQATEYVVDGVTGSLSQPNEVVSMTSAAIQILGDRSRGRALGLAARDDVLARWSWERQTRSIDQAIASLRKRSVSRDSATHVPR
jgi:glycosyltransferase involved in cell wall biosynthesis